jgi:hypothetical protein
VFNLPSVDSEDQTFVSREVPVQGGVGNPACFAMEFKDAFADAVSASRAATRIASRLKAASPRGPRIA